MSQVEIHRGNELAPGEEVVWRGAPTFRGIVREVFHMRAASGYFVVLFAFDALQAWRKGLAPAKALHDTVPLMAITVLALAILAVLAFLVARTTRYTMTDRRIILHYGVAITATLSIPFSQILSAEAAVYRDHTGDIALTLKGGNRMPYLKLWPHARAWQLSQPQPMLRVVPQAAVVSGLLARALQSAEHTRVAVATRPAPAFHAMPTPTEVAA